MKDDAGGLQDPPDAHRWRSAIPVATMFLTRLPVRAPASALAGAVIGFPVVGAVVGGIGGVVYGLVWLTGLPPPICALIGVAAMVVLTGALHEDGLGDMADGLAGGTSAEAIRIMRDSRIGGYGVLALIFSVGLRVTTLAAMAEPLAVLTATVATGTASRTAMAGVMRWLPAAANSGLGAGAGRPERVDVYLAIAAAAILVTVVLGPGMALALAGGTTIGAWLVAMLARRRIGGYTGDVLGAAQQAAEIAGLLAIAAAMQG
ncbi:MAG: adenosylcobinamide-GDP ribazoletransferase [Rhodospirillales bacterium]|nr:MAG: adenosylcobinamide-GDP ribazoletransferase [Rhodospirillales bacterium]